MLGWRKLPLYWRFRRIHRRHQICGSGVIAQTGNIQPHAEDRKRLLAIAGDRNRPLKHVQRAKIILFPPNDCPCWRSRGGPGSVAPPSGVGNNDMANKA